MKKFLTNHNSSNTAGPQDISTLIFKNTCSAMFAPVSLLFFRPISMGHLPASWKIMKLPNSKEYCSTDPLHWRPFSLLPILSKVNIPPS